MGGLHGGEASNPSNCSRLTMKRNPLNREQHDATGADLFAMRAWTMRLAAGLAARYGKSGPVGRQAEALRKALDRLRCALDDQAAADLGDGFEPSLYYRAHLPTEAQ
jgi:hypothetical protein